MLRQHKEEKIFVEVYKFKVFEKRLENFKERQEPEEDIVGKKAGQTVRDSLFPKDDQRKEFGILFDSVRKGIGMI